MPDPTPDPTTPQPGLIARMRARYAEQAASGELARARRIGAIGIPIGLLLLAGYRHFTRPGLDAIPFTVGVMPACDSIPARRLLRQVLEQASKSKQAGATVQRLGVVQETGYVPVGAKGLEIRMCQADAFLNVGRSDVPFTLEWTTPAKDELWIEAEPPF